MGNGPAVAGKSAIVSPKHIVCRRTFSAANGGLLNVKQTVAGHLLVALF